MQINIKGSIMTALLSILALWIGLQIPAGIFVGRFLKRMREEASDVVS